MSGLLFSVNQRGRGRVSSLGVKQLGCEADNYLHLVPRLRMSVALPTCPPICLYGMHWEFTCTACQAYLQQYIHGQHLEVKNIFVMYQSHVVWQKTATLQNFVKPETITYWLTQTAIQHRANHRSLDSPSVSKRDKCLLSVTSILDAL